MKIEKINSNKIKIMFDSDELEENNISVHSFLSNSYDAQKLFLAILDIADEEFGFNAKNSKINYETISFDNKKFIIIITKSLDKIASDSTNPYNLLDICNLVDNDCKFDNNIPPEKLYFPIYNIANDTKFLLYKFDDMDDLCSFCNYLNSFFPTQNFSNSLYQYNEKYFLEINLENQDIAESNMISSIISEYTDSIFLNELTILKLKEFSTLIIENNAIQLLTN